MSARATPTGSTSRAAKRVPLVDSVRFPKPATGKIGKPSQLQGAKPQPKNGETRFRCQDLSHESWAGQKNCSS